MPLLFCSTRWVESKAAAQRAIQVWPDITEIVKYWNNLPPSKRPRCSSYNIVKCAVLEDNLIVVKLHFFSFVAFILEPFLTIYQSSSPLVPFMFDDLYEVLESLLRLVMKPEKLNEMTLFRIANLDFKDQNLYKNSPDVGCGAFNLLKRLQREDQIDAKSIFDFHAQCHKFVVIIVEKVRDRTLRGLRFMKAASALNPLHIKNSSHSLCETRFKNLVHQLSLSNLITNADGDFSCIAYTKLIRSPQNLMKFKNYSRCVSLDTFFLKLSIFQ